MHFLLSSSSFPGILIVKYRRKKYLRKPAKLKSLILDYSCGDKHTIQLDGRFSVHSDASLFSCSIAFKFVRVFYLLCLKQILCVLFNFIVSLSYQISSIPKTFFCVNICFFLLCKSERAG